MTLGSATCAAMIEKLARRSTVPRSLPRAAQSATASALSEMLSGLEVKEWICHRHLSANEVTEVLLPGR